LNTTEQSAVTMLCFFEGTWNEQNLQPVEVGLVVMVDTTASLAQIMDTRKILWIGLLVLSPVLGSLIQF
jgi:hypothetical protein